MKETKYDDQVRIDGKVYYKTCHRCGCEKNAVTMYYCNSCNNEYYRQKLIKMGKTPRVKKSISEKVVNPKQIPKSVLKNEENLKTLNLLYTDINNFIIRVSKNNGWVSVQDIFVTLITLYNRSTLDCKNINYRQIDTLEPKDQLEYMWSHIKKVKDSIKNS